MRSDQLHSRRRRDGRRRAAWRAVLAIVLGSLIGGPPPLPVAAAGPVCVDGAGGADTPTCGAAGTPCASIGYALAERAAAGDTLRVAEGTYAEQVTLPFTVTIEGGYEAAAWTRDVAAHPTVIDGGAELLTAADWDAGGVRHPAVLAENGGYTMWYVGIDPFGHTHIGRAVSADGLAWTKDAAAGLHPGAAGAWDAGSLSSPTVVHQGGTYHMWYGARNAAGSAAIGYATSADGVTWTKYAGNPVVRVGTADWNNTVVRDPHVLFSDGTYHMWVVTEGRYTCVEASVDSECSWTYFGHLTSANGSGWTWDGNYAFESTYPAIAGPCVVPEDTWHLWYAVEDTGRADLALLTSADGAAWQRHAGLVFQPEMSGWEASLASNPAVVATEGVTATQYTLWYEGRDGLGAATSTDGISWARLSADPVLAAGDPGDWHGATITATVPGAAVTLDGLSITGGSGLEAGGVLFAGGELTVRDCRLYGNRVGTPQERYGAGLTVDGTVHVYESAITGNQSIRGGGGLSQAGGELELRNVLVADNLGDGLYLSERAALMNVTVAGNSIGVMVPSGADAVTLTNSIVYGNSVDLYSNVTPNELAVTYCDVGGGAAGSGNTAADPRYAGAESGDYRLRLGSPAADAGTATGAPTADLAGTPRPLDGDLDRVARVDMGAYELQLLPVCLPWAGRNAR